MPEPNTVIETCVCGAKWEGSRFYASERVEWREAHRGCREAFVLRGDPGACRKQEAQEVGERLQSTFDKLRDEIDSERAGPFLLLDEAEAIFRRGGREDA